jgi:predicted GNAT family acetyltransferase
MQVVRFVDPDAFARRVEPFLLRHEAEHNLALGIIGGLRRPLQPAPPSPRQPPYLALVEDAGEVVAVAVRTTLQLALSRLEGGRATEALDRLVADLAPHGGAVEGALPGVVGPAAPARAFAERGSARTGRPARRSMAMRIYRLDAVTSVTGVPGALRPATPADGALAARWVLAFQHDIGEGGDPAAAVRLADERIRAGGLYLWAAGPPPGRPVSMANAGGATPHGNRINLVYTPPEHRRRGYASACVAALSQAMLDAGRRFCFLYTDLANPTSNHIYQDVGYRPVADADAYRFLPPAPSARASGEAGEARRAAGQSP